LEETRVEVRMALPGNVALYESLGYVPISYQPHPLVPDAMTVKMAKRLSADTRREGDGTIGREAGTLASKGT
ncbi:MAG: hypothetical protein M3Y37_04945, partial [Chloroflexota bacterium]|nr:hypothetical protein [Chloroflexota bacterium]